jgi:hypothetical protein
MASFADYAPGGVKHPDGGLEDEIVEAGAIQEDRQRDPSTGQFVSTPEDVDWENRYKELEQHNSRQAQELGGLRNENTRYKSAFDDYLLNPTPVTEQAPVQLEGPVTTDDLLERPDQVINQAIENHPAIREAQVNAENARRTAILDAKSTFEGSHPKYQETMSDPAFAEWVRASNTRIGLAQQADQWDFQAADALFTLYEAEQKLNGMTAQSATDTALQNATLESAGIGEPPPEARYSRREMREHMIKSRQGNQESERYLEVHLPMYREALAAKLVTD